MPDASYPFAHHTNADGSTRLYLQTSFATIGIAEAAEYLFPVGTFYLRISQTQAQARLCKIAYGLIHGGEITCSKRGCEALIAKLDQPLNCRK